MKRLLTLASIVLFTAVAHAQLNPVSWTFTTKKIDDKTFEVHMKATIQTKWHLYSQTQPSDAIVNPTSFSLNSNPLLTLDGAIKEEGKMEKFHDAKLGISANQYAGNVDFVQVVKLKAKAKTNVTGSVEYQTCDDQKCLPPKTINFSVTLQ